MVLIPKAGDAFVEIHGDFGPLNAQLRGSGFNRSLGGIQTSATRSFRTVGVEAEKAGRVAGPALRKTGAEAERVGQKAEGAGGRVSLFGRTAERTGGLLGSPTKRLIAFGAGFASASAAISGARNAVETTEDLSKGTLALHRNLGLTIKDASRWAGVAKARNIDTTDLSTSFTNLSKNVEKALSPKPVEASVKAFDALGVSTEDLKRGQTDFGFLTGKVAEGLGKMEGGTQRAAVAQQLLGRSSQNTLPIFTQGRKAMEEQLKLADKYGVTLDGKTIKSVRELIQVQKELEFAQLGLQIQFTRTFGPVLTKAFAGASKFINDTRKIFNRDDLTGEEKWNKFGDMVSQKIEEAVPQIANAAGRIAPKVALGFIRGFFHADAWGQLAAGTFLISKLASWDSLFKAAGRRSGITFGKAMAVGAIAGLGLFIVEWELKHKQQIHRVGREVGEAFINGMIDVVNAGIGKLNGPLSAIGKLPGVPDIEIPKIGHVDLRDWDEHVNAAHRLRDAYKTIPKKVDTLIKGETEGTVRKVDSLAHKLESVGRKKTVTRILADSDSAKEAIRRLKFQLDHLPAQKKVKIILEEQRKRGAPAGPLGPDALDKLIPPRARQRGGMIPGTGDGDKVHVLAEPGEGFINKRAVRALGGPAAIDRINRTIPRFQHGGVVSSTRRRKKDEHDPTAKQGQPDRESRRAETGFRRVAPEASAASVPGGIVGRADKLDRLHLPYVWGGGHGSIGQALKGGFDCSGAVSYVLGIPARVSGDFKSWGKPGEGVVSTFSNTKHVVMSAAGRLFGTGDGTGPHWLAGGPESRFSAPFVTRHIGEAGSHFDFKDSAAPKLISGKLTLGQYVTVAKQVGFPDPALAAAIFWAESRGKIGAELHTGKEWSLGGAQINVQAHKALNNKADRERLRRDIFFNFREAKKISHGGRDFTPWTKYTTGEYKEFLGGTAQALPQRGTAGTGSSLADFLALRLEEVRGGVNLDNDIKVLRQLVKYWGGIYKRSRAAGRNDRALSALQSFKQYKTELKETRQKKHKKPERELFKLGDLASIGQGPGAVNIGGLQPQLDRINVDIAEALLTEDYDSEGQLIPSTMKDDISAYTRLQGFWENVQNLVTGNYDPGIAGFQTPDRGAPVIHRLNSGQYAANVNGKTITFSAKPGQVIKLGGKRSIVPDEQGRALSAIKRPVVTGTPAQKIEAATNLHDARDQLRQLQDDVKKYAPPGAAEATEAAAQNRQDVQNFFAQLGEILKSGSNLKPVQSFGGGGIIQGPKGKAVVIEGHGGEAVIGEDGNLTVHVKRDGDGPAQPQVVKQIHQENHFQEGPPDPHSWSRQSLFELEAA